MKAKAVFYYVLAVAFLFYEMALQVSPSVMTQQLMYDFNIGASVLGFMASCYFFSYAFMQIPAGILFDRFSPQLLLSLSILICSLGAYFFGETTTVYFAGLGRFMMGFGSAFAFIGVLVVASQWFEKKYFAFLVGIAQLLAALGAMGGELPLAHLVNAFGWRYVMLGQFYIGLVLMLLVALFLHGHPDHNSKRHAIASHFWSDLKEIFAKGQTWWIALYAFSGWAPVAVFAALWGVPFLMHKYGVSNTQAAASTAMVWIGIGFVAPFIGFISDLMKRRMVLMRTCAIAGLLSSISLLYVPSIPFEMTFILLFIMGCASAGQILSFALVSDINRPRVVGTAIGLNNMAVVIGGALFQPLAGYVLGIFWDGRVAGGYPIYSELSYQIALLVVPLSYALGVITSVFCIRETYCESALD